MSTIIWSVIPDCLLRYATENKQLNIKEYRRNHSWWWTLRRSFNVVHLTHSSEFQMDKNVRVKLITWPNIAWSKGISRCNINKPARPRPALDWCFRVSCLARRALLTHSSTSRPPRWSSRGRGRAWSSLSPSSVSSPPPPELQCRRDHSPGSTAWSPLSSCACIVTHTPKDILCLYCTHKTPDCVRSSFVPSALLLWCYCTFLHFHEKCICTAEAPKDHLYHYLNVTNNVTTW